MTESTPVFIDRDATTNKAIEIILGLYFEGVIYNLDHLGYWEIFNHHLIEISTYSFRAGLNDFYQAIESHPNSKELVAYHLRTLTRLINTDSVRDAAIALYDNFKENWMDYRATQANFDLLQNGHITDISVFSKIIFFIHIYSDVILINTVLEKEKLSSKQTTSRKFRG